MKKLKLKKEVIVDLNNEEMKGIYGGIDNIRSVYPCPGISFQICGDNSYYCPGTHTCPARPTDNQCYPSGQTYCPTPPATTGCPTPGLSEMTNCGRCDPTTPPPTDPDGCDLYL